MGFLCGIPFFLGIFSWVLTVGKYAFLHHLILEFYLWTYFGIFGLLFCLITRRWRVEAAFISAPFLWVILEFIRANFFFLALPWGILGYSQHNNLPIIQIASFVGTYGISFLIVAVNAALAMMTIYCLQKVSLGKIIVGLRYPVSGSVTFILAAFVASLFLVAYGYGKNSLSDEPNEEHLHISIVQGNIEQSKKWEKKYAAEIMRIYTDLTQKASENKPDLIVWPETATPWALNLDSRLKKQVADITKDSGTHLMLGSAQAQKFKLNDLKSAKFKNSVYLVSPEGVYNEQRYDKIYLLPFGEYLPYSNKIPWHLLKVPEIGSYIPGKEFVVFSTPSARFSATICWENVFSDIFRRFVKNGAQFVVNITNEAWFGKTSAPYHFLSMSVLRAVENRVSVVRCANTGVSCFIDPCGRITDRVKGVHGADIFVRGVLTKPVMLSESKTLYTRYGEFFPKICGLISIIVLIAAIFRKRYI